ncbi:MAG: orotate phosphoribosyltransferase [Candidatus Altiarchaeia archaeon]|jgi:hypothetical protein
MESAGLCDICKKSGYLSSCVLCGKRVCTRCVDPMKGVCIACKRGTDIGLSGEGIKELD